MQDHDERFKFYQPSHNPQLWDEKTTKVLFNLFCNLHPQFVGCGNRLQNKLIKLPPEFASRNFGLRDDTLYLQKCSGISHFAIRKLRIMGCEMKNSQIINFKLSQSANCGLWDEIIFVKYILPQLTKSTQIMHKFQKFN